MILQPLFESINQFSKSASGVDTSMSLSDYESAATPAKKRLCNIITSGVYDAIVKGEGDAKELLRQSIANLTLYYDVPHYVQRKRRAEVEVYKNEAESLKRTFIDVYFSAVDSLLQYLNDAPPEDILAAWKTAPYYALLDQVKIKTTEEFNMLYPIDSSYLFFFRTLPIQKSVYIESLSAYYERTDRQDLISRLDRALAQLTVAKALTRFDPIEFPATIRNIWDDINATRNLDKDQSRLLQLSATLASEAMDILATVDNALSESTDVGSFDTDHREDDKFYLIP